MSEVLETLLVLFKGESGQLETTLKRIERETAETGGKVRKSLDFGQIGAGLAGLAGGGGIIAFLRSAAQESARTEAATRSFENAVKRQNVSLDDAGAVVERLAGRFGLLETDVQEAASILIKSGLDLKTVEDSLTAVGASAASAVFDIATGMKNGAVGIAFGRSEVLETSGVIVNASQGWKTYADSIGVSTDALTDQQKALGFAQAIIQESSGDVEDFDTNFKGLVKSQADVNRELKEFRDNVGAVAAEGVVPLNNALSSGIELYSSVPEPVQRTAVAMVAAAGGATALAGGVGTLALVLGPLAGPAGLFILAAAGSAALVTAFTTQKNYVTDLRDEYKKYRGDLDLNTQKEREAAQKSLETTKQGVEARIKVLEAAIETQRNREGALLNNPITQFLIPGGATYVDDPRQVEQLKDLRKLLADVKIDQQDVANGASSLRPNEAKPPPSITPAGTPTAPSPASGSKDRTVADVFADLNKEGTVAEQKAQALGTVEAAVESLETRARAADSALTEALELGASGEQISYLVGRVQSLNDELTALGERPITIEAEVELARAIELPDVQAFVAELVDIPNPEVQVQITGDPVDIFGVVFDPVTGTTTIGAAPTIKIKAEVDIPDPAVRAILNTQERQILGTGFEAGSSTQKDYGPGAYATVTPSVPLLTSPDYQGALPTVDIDAAYDGITSAGEQFNQSVLDAGLGFVSNIANALADGKITGNEAAGIGSALGAAGGFALGNLLLPGIGGELGKIGGGLLGGGIGGALGGESEEDSRSRAASELERRGGVSSLSIQVFANQVNEYTGSPSDPGVAQQFDRNLRRFIEETVKQMDLGKLQKQPV